MTDHLDAVRTALNGQYRVEREIGRGGAATVYLAHDLRHDRPVAVKALHPDLATAVGAERFLHEIEVTARLQHPHILPLLDSGCADGVPYFVTPYADGGSLHDLLRAERRLPVRQAIQIAKDIAGALAYAHRHRVVHLDIKPGNILLFQGHPVVADFGIARAICDSCRDPWEAAEFVAGTPEYMSPEQVSGLSPLDARSDVYSLGCVLFEMLTGSAPFRAATPRGVMRHHLITPPLSVTTMRPSAPSSVGEVLMAALVKAPGDRLASSEAFEEALAGASVELLRTTRRAAPTHRSVPTAHLAKRAMATALLSLALALLSAMVLQTNATKTDARGAPAPRSALVTDAGPDATPAVPIVTDNRKTC